MSATLEALRPILQYLAAPAGAGLVASYILGATRRRFPAPPRRPAAALLAIALQVLHTPRYTRYLALALAAVIGAAAAAALASLAGGDPLAAADVALAGSIAAIAGQLAHAQQLPLEARS